MKFPLKAKIIFYLLFLCVGLLSCDRYRRENDRIYTIPKSSNWFAQISLQALEDAQKKYPNSQEVFYKKAMAHFLRYEHSSALEHISKALKLDSAQGKYFMLQAQIYQALEETEKALEAVKKAYTPENESFELFIFSAELYFENKEYKKANQFLRRAEYISSIDPRIYYLKGNIFFEQYDTARAVKNLKIALKKQPNYLAAYNGLATLYNRYEMFNTAIRWANKGLRYDIQNAGLNFNKAEAFRAKPYLEDSAKIYYKRAYQSNKRLYKASFRLGIYAFKAGKYSEAQQYFEETLAEKGDWDEAYFYLGRCQVLRGNYEESLISLKKAMELAPRNYAARDLYWNIKTKVDQRKFRERQDSIRRARILANEAS